MPKGGDLVDVLLVEDNPGDIRLTREALKDAKVGSRLHVVRNGVEALAFLRQQGQYSDSSRPGLILLDLNLPRKNGWEVLTEIKEDKDLSSIPVVVLTTSASPRDVLLSYQLHANSFVVKPVGFQGFTEVVRAIDDFWLSRATLPSHV